MPVVDFRPILFASLWLATWHVSMPGGSGMRQFGDAAWTGWVILGLLCPPLLFLSWWLIERTTGTWRYRGMYVRVAADAGQSLALMAYLYVRVISHDLNTDVRVYAWTVMLGCTLFILQCLGMDVSLIVKTERIAAQERRGLSERLASEPTEAS